MPSLKALKAENKQRKKDAITHISAAEATRRTGFGSDGARVSERRKEEEKELDAADKKDAKMFASIFCAVM
jgi:hypothetical protein